MDHFELYHDIQARTGGEVYMAVVGPVRTGKSTFIRRFMEMMVLPNIEESEWNELTDQLPVSGSGKTITTVEPKFIPKKAVSIPLAGDDETKALRLRLIDCVGYMVDGAGGHMENGQERMVKTPWSEEEIPFSRAGDIGTRKVIFDHSTVGLVMTTDGSFGEIPRENYIPPEERTVEELKSIGKPFLMILNSDKPASRETKQLAEELSQKYGVSVLPMNCDQLRQEDLDRLFAGILEVFPISEIAFYWPKWMDIVSETDPLYEELIREIGRITGDMRLMKDVPTGRLASESEFIENFQTEECSMETGRVCVRVNMKEVCYYNMLSKIIGEPIEGEYRFMKVLKELAEVKQEYAKIKNAWDQVRQTGYGVVSPVRGEVNLEEPELIRQGNKYGVKIRAMAPSVQMIKAEITTEIAPIVGSEEQASDLIRYIQDLSEENPEGIWETNIFGKTMGHLIEEGISMKIARLTEESQKKLQESMQKIINESNGGLVCFII